MPTDREKPSVRSQSDALPHLTRNGFNAIHQELGKIPRILLIRLRSLGDSILTLPLIEALHKWRPELELDILAETPFVPVFEHHPAVHKVLILKTRQQGDCAGWSRPRALWEIWKQRYPAVINLHGGTTSRLFTIASRARMRMGQALHRGSWIYNIQIPSSSDIWQRNSIHTVEHQLTVMRWLGLPLPGEPASSLHVGEDARRRIQARLKQAGISEYLLIHPTATLATKQWKPECFGQLGDLLFRRYGLPVIYTAAAHELPVLQKIQKQSKEIHSFWADLPLADLFALIEGCHLFVGNDSGPTHAAAALSKPVVVVWGSSNFAAWHPWNTLYEAVRSDLPCIPCPGYKCAVYKEPKCILDITVERVADACNLILTRLTPNSP